MTSDPTSEVTGGRYGKNKLFSKANKLFSKAISISTILTASTAEAARLKMAFSKGISMAKSNCLTASTASTVLTAS